MNRKAAKGEFFEDEALGKAFDLRLMRRLLVYLRPHRLAVALCVAALLLAATLQTLPSRLIGLSVKNIVDQDVGTLGLLVSLMGAAILIQLVIDYFRALAMLKVGQSVIYELRTSLFRHIQKMPLRFFDRNPVGRLMTRVGNDIETLDRFFSNSVANVFMDLFLLVAIIIQLFTINAHLAAITMLVLPPTLVLSFWFRKNARQCYRNTRMRLARVNAYLQENISGMRVVQIFNRQEKNQEKMDRLNDELRGEWYRAIFFHSSFFAMMELISQICTATVVVYGGWVLVRPEAIDAGQLTAFVLLTRMFYEPIRRMSASYNDMQSAMASSERIFQILDTEPTIVPEEPVATLDGPIESIEFRDVRFSYIQGEEVLKGISFTVKRGQTVALVGATGAGKSTIINLLCRFYDIDSGEIRINGIGLRHYDLPALRRKMAIVLQDVFLFSGTVADNIRLGESSITDEQVEQAARFVNADRFIQKIPDGYAGRITERGTSVSTGQRQLLSFARALAFQPDLLILDEATSSVDTETESLIQDALGKLMATRTSIVIAHRLSTIQRADMIIVMHHGEIRESGTHKELVQQRGIYHTLYELQYEGQQVFDG